MDKLKRWNRVALEAAKQCGRGIVPMVLPQMDLHEALAQIKAMDLGLMPYEVLGHMGDHSLKNILQAGNPSSIGI